MSKKHIVIDWPSDPNELLKLVLKHGVVVARPPASPQTAIDADLLKSSDDISEPLHKARLRPGSDYSN
ncbi:MAG: hypothetical protein HOO99_05030 [Hyphomicrobiaceae bacterium]|nr:hypothetical protein [Hyphomicrobiaceae bacterium]